VPALLLVAVLSFAGAAADAAAAAAPVRAKKPAARIPMPEAVEMLLAILAGGGAGPGMGWFHPSQSCYDWKWLAEHMDANRDGIITRKEFKGPRVLFDRLDRDGDGRLTRADFDWSPRSPLVQQGQFAAMLFRRGNTASDGRLSKAEWEAMFKHAAKGKDYLTPEDLRTLLFPPSRPPAKAPPPGAGMPSRWMLVKGLFSGEIGSMREGPKVGDMAPSFRLPTQDGKRAISLADYRGKKPVVLVFGSFT
jgi:hypothetical protein